MNQFDFYQITVETTRKSNLKGIAPERIQSEQRRNPAYGGRYTRKWYTATAAFVEAVDAHKVDEIKTNIAAKYPNCIIRIQYHAR